MRILKIETRFLLVVILFSFIAKIGISQTEEVKPGIGRGTLDSQFRYMIYQSDKLDNSRVVKSWWLFNIKKQVEDSLSKLQGNIYVLNDTIGLLGGKIDSLEAALVIVKDDLTGVTSEKDNIIVLGVTLKKTVYNVLMWVLVGILVFALIVFILMFKRGHVVTKEARTDLKEIKEEFEAFRKRALEREREVTRKLYDEVLKYKNKFSS